MELEAIKKIEDKITDEATKEYIEYADERSSKIMDNIDKALKDGNLNDYDIYLKRVKVKFDKSGKAFTKETREKIIKNIIDSKLAMIPFAVTHYMDKELEAIMTDIESKLIKTIPRYAIQKYYEEQLQSNKLTKTIYKNNNVLVKKDRDLVYKSKKVYDEFDENLHELIISIMGTNYLPHRIFSKVVGGVIKDDEVIVISKFYEGIIFGQWLKKYCYEETSTDMCSELRNILFDLVEGLYKANKMIGFVHNDLHSSNIIINEQDDHKAVIIDYGRSRVVIDDKIYFYPYKVTDLDHYKNIWWNDIFKVLIDIYTYVDYKVNIRLLTNDIRVYAVNKITGKPKDVKKALDVFKNMKIKYLPEDDNTDIEAHDVINAYDNILKCKKLNKNPPCIANMAYIIRD